MLFKLVWPRFWHRKNLTSYLLLPLSWVYLIGSKIIKVYRQRIAATNCQLKAPIIIVGNIIVGGTGKTPLAICLANLLKKHHYSPGIITRGYGRKKNQQTLLVTYQSTPEEVGDEVLLIAKHTSCPIIVSRNRVEAASKLIQQHHCNVIISDDGLQHYKLPRYLEIVLSETNAITNNNFCLPAGPYREPLKRLDTVDLIVKNFNTDLVSFQASKNYSLALEVTNIRKVNDPKQIKLLKYFNGLKLHAIAGIGNPKKFFDTLKTLGLDVIEHHFPDHHWYQASDFKNLKGPIIMTEKDAIKCIKLANDNFWYLETLPIISTNLETALLSKLKTFTHNQPSKLK